VGPRAGLDVVEKRKFLTLIGIDQGVGGWTILKWILEGYDGMIWIGLIWLKWDLW
jgi:hypothetical protein